MGKDLANKQAEQCKTTTVEVHAEVGKIIRFISSKSIVVFHCFALLQAALVGGTSQIPGSPTSM